MTRYRDRRESGMYAPPKGGGQPAAQPAAEQPAADLDAMTKPQLLEHAQQIGVSPANNSMSKEELRAAIDRKTGGG